VGQEAVTPGAIGGTLLTSVGKQHRSAVVSVVQLALFLSLFYALWPMYQLLGVVLAMGLSMAISSFLLIQAARYRNEVKFSFARDYAVFAIALIAAAILDLRLAKLGPGVALLAWPAVVFAVLRVGALHPNGMQNPGQLLPAGPIFLVAKPVLAAVWL